VKQPSPPLPRLSATPVGVRLGMLELVRDGGAEVVDGVMVTRSGNADV